MRLGPKRGNDLQDKRRVGGQLVDLPLSHVIDTRTKFMEQA